MRAVGVCGIGVRVVGVGAGRSGPAEAEGGEEGRCGGTGGCGSETLPSECLDFCFQMQNN